MMSYERSKAMPISFFSLGEMIAFAASRSCVHLDDGRVATLVRWATPKRPKEARVMFLNGNSATVKLNRITKVEIPTTTGEQNDNGQQRATTDGTRSS